MKIIFLIPAYNQTPWNDEFQQKLRWTCKRLEEANFETAMVFVDDGSTREGTELEHHQTNLQSIGNCEVFATRHYDNRGQGAALMTALIFARSKEINGDFFVTMDSDGQHDPKDVFNLLTEIREKKVNIVFGNRFAGNREILKQIPPLRRLVLRLASRFEYILTGLKLTDAHNGFRVFDATAARMLDIKQGRMAHATEIKQIVAKKKLKYSEAPISIRYSEESIKGGQRNINAVNILQELFQGWMFQ